MEDTYHLDRFVTAQEDSYETARTELANGRKRGHWIWFVFPQLAGLGSSWNSIYFGISGSEEAIAYLEHPELGERLRHCTTLVLTRKNVSLAELFGSQIDVLKFHACMTLFSAVAPEEAVFSDAIRTCFDGIAHQKTLLMLQNP
jgi:uncharacterized protein (DUF1810 family)